MQSLPLDRLPLLGALDVDRTADGVVYRRLPAWTRPQITDPALALMLTMPAGVRLRFSTTAPELELEVMATILKLGDLPFQRPAFDLVGAGEQPVTVVADDFTAIAVDLKTFGFEYELGRPATIRFEALPGDPARPLEIWFPHNAVVELRAVRIPAGAELVPAPHPGRRWIHYGSSISHCAEAPTPTSTWPAIVARLAGADLTNLAVGGQCLLDQHVARTIRDLPADCISVKAGINVVNGDLMRERTYHAALHGFLDTVRDGHPETPLLLVTPIICPVAEDHPGPTPLGDDRRVHVVPRPPELSAGSLSLRRIRQLTADVVDARRGAGDRNLHLLDGYELFGERDLEHLPDGLHPDPAGYRLIGERFHRLAFSEGGVFAPAEVTA